MDLLGEQATATGFTGRAKQGLQAASLVLQRTRKAFRLSLYLLPKLSQKQQDSRSSPEVPVLHNSSQSLQRKKTM
ncbi:Hypothetical predicted protein, partial [Podarcis lilfordi]